MAAEYSYFRAEGGSLSAIDAVTEAKAELGALKKKLCAHFGADDMMGGFDKETGGFDFVAFVLHAEEKIPKGWKVDRQMSNDGSHLQAAFGLPPEGSAEHFHMANMGGLMVRAARNSRLERVFGIEDMPMKSLPAGEYHGEFVRHANLKTADEERQPGRLRDNVTFCFGSNCAGRGSDPLDFMKLQEKWYIRVPNKPGTEEPQFRPPDAVPAAYDEVLLADLMEFKNRNGPRFSGPLC